LHQSSLIRAQALGKLRMARPLVLRSLGEVGRPSQKQAHSYKIGWA